MVEKIDAGCSIKMSANKKKSFISNERYLCFDECIQQS